MLNLNFRGQQTTKRKKVLCLRSPSEVRLKAGGEGGDGGGGQVGGWVGQGGGGGHHNKGVDEDKEQLAGREENHVDAR